MFTITVYHGSKEKLEMRKIDREAGVGTADGIGFYTATDIERANMYGDFITEFDLELKKELSSNEVTLSRDILAEMVEETSYWENYGEPYGNVTLQDLVNESVLTIKEGTVTLLSIVPSSFICIRKLQLKG